MDTIPVTRQRTRNTGQDTLLRQIETEAGLQVPVSIGGQHFTVDDLLQSGVEKLAPGFDPRQLVAKAKRLFTVRMLRVLDQSSIRHLAERNAAIAERDAAIAEAAQLREQLVQLAAQHRDEVRYLKGRVRYVQKTNKQLELTPQDVSYLHTLHEYGMSLSDIAECFEVDVAVMRRVFETHKKQGLLARLKRFAQRVQGHPVRQNTGTRKLDIDDAQPERQDEEVEVHQHVTA